MEKWEAYARARPSIFIFMGLAILGLDFATGPFLQFPILFVLPVSLCAWYYRTDWAYAMALLLPAGRFLILDLIYRPHPLGYMIANTLVRMVVLSILAFLAGRTARLTKQLQARVSELVTMCAWSRTVEYQGEWISFEKYLKRRFNLDTSHGVSPAEAEKIFGVLDEQPSPNGVTVPEDSTHTPSPVSHSSRPVEQTEPKPGGSDS